MLEHLICPVTNGFLMKKIEGLILEGSTFMKYTKAILCGAFLSILAFMIGCAPTAQDEPIPTTQSPENEKARIVISRPADDIDCSGWLFVYDDGKQVGSIGCGGALIWDRPLGKITLTARGVWGRFTPYYLNATESKTYNLYISYLHYRTIKTFSLDVYPSVSDKNSYTQDTVKKQPSKAADPGFKSKTPLQVEKWGLIIGISNYKDTRIPGLRYSAADAKAFYKWSVSPEGGKYSPSRVKLLLDQEATGRNIRNALFVWLKQALEEDMVTIYFAGHGSPSSPDSPTNLFLLPHDADYKDIATTGFPMWDIDTALRRFVKAKKVVVIADACHSGGIGHDFDIARRDSRGIKVNSFSTELQKLSKIGDGICIISASDDKQFSQESQKWGGGHGVFTYFLLKGLEGEADYNNDTRVTLGELIPYLSEQVRRETSNSQAPTVAGKFDPALGIGR